MVADMKTYERFIKNSVRLSALLMLYSVIIWVGSETSYEIFAAISATLLLWTGLVLKDSAVANFFDPMLLPSCFIVTAITGFSVFRFSASVQNETVAALFLIALSGAFIFAIFRLFQSPGDTGKGSRAK